jgi:hypothetical protein
MSQLPVSRPSISASGPSAGWSPSVESPTVHELAYHVVGVVHYLDALPRNKMGKVLKKSLSA